MKNLYLISTLVALFSLNSFSQNNNWLQTYGDSEDESIVDVKVSSGDSVVIAGTLDTGSTSLGSFNLENKAFFNEIPTTVLAKFDAIGNVAWAFALGGESERAASAMDVDINGNIYIIGVFKQEVDLDPLGGGDTLILSGDGDIFVAKYSPTGNLAWSQHLFSGMGGDFSAGKRDIRADNQGNVYITAEFTAGDAYLKNRSDTVVRPAGAVSYSALIQLDANNGNMNWANAYTNDNGSDPPNLSAIDVDASANVYLAGVVSDTTDFNPNGTSTSVEVPDRSTFFAQYNSQGILQWITNLEASGGGSPEAYLNGMQYSGGAILATGGLKGTSYSFDSFSGNLTQSQHYYLTRVDVSSGTPTGFQLFLAPKAGAGGIAASGDSLLIFGAFADSVDFDPGAGTDIFHSGNDTVGDAFVAIYDTSFTYRRAIVFGDSANLSERALRGGILSNGNIVVGGDFEGLNSDFQPGSGTVNATQHGGKFDVFVTSFQFGPSGPVCNVDSAGPITGPVDVCQFDKSLVYSIDTVGNSNATNFTWSFSNGPQPTKVVGQGTRTISIDITNDPFTIEVTPSNSICQGATSTLAINNPGLPPALADTVRQQPNCGQSNGSIDVEVTNGSPAPYTYIWSNGDTLDTLVGLPSGSYTVSVTDANGCFNEVTIALNDLGAPQIDSSDITNADCFSEATGAIDISVSGGATPYSYFWSNGDTVEDPQNLQAGGYRVEITDSTGCRYTEILIVGQPNALSTNLSITDASTCGASDGQVTAFTSGGAQPYTVNWSSGGSGNSISSLSAGSYSVTITDDNLCTYDEQFAISETGAPVIGLDSIGHEDCLDTNGYVAASLTGGTSPSYSWSNGASGSLMISDLGAGIYTLSVTDGSCTAVRQFEVEKVAPESFPICMVTVDDSVGRNIVVWEKPYKSSISSFEIMRESWQDDVFIRVAESHVDTLSQYIDMVANPQLKAWTYSMVTHDVCGASSEISAQHTTMHLVMQRDTSGPIDLNWNAYGGLQHSLYYIERLTDTAVGWVLIDSVSAPLTSYRDLGAPKQTDLLYAIAIDHPRGGCQTSRAAPKKYGSVRSSRSINAGENPTIGIEPPDTTLVKEVEIPEWGISVYPNPSTGLIQIRTKGVLERTEMRIMDMSGRSLMSGSLDKELEELDLSPLGAGVYLIQLSRGSDMRMQRIVIQ